METTPIRLGDVLQIERIPVDIDSEIKYVQIGIRSFGRGIFHRDPVPGDELGKLRYFEIHPRRLIVSNIMAWEGAIALSSDSDVGCVGSNRFLSYAPTGGVDLAYLNFFFQSELGMKLISRTSTGTVVRNQTLSMADFEDLVVPLPGIVEQRRCAARLHSTMLTLDKVQRAREHTVKYFQHIRHSLLSGIRIDRFLGDALDLCSSRVDVIPDTTYAIAGIYSFGRGLIRRPPIVGSQTRYQRFTPLKAGQVVMSKLNAWEGALAVVDDQFSGCHVSAEYPVFDIDAAIAIPGYIKHLVTWPDLWQKLMPRGSMVRRKRTHPDVLLSLRVPMPDIPAQIEISQQLDQLSSAENLRIHQDRLIGALRKASVNAAFSGHR
jgi:type I restriction enzyme S subunit